MHLQNFKIFNADMNVWTCIEYINKGSQKIYSVLLNYLHNYVNGTVIRCRLTDLV